MRFLRCQSILDKDAPIYGWKDCRCFECGKFVYPRKRVEKLMGKKWLKEFLKGGETSEDFYYKKRL
jgi:hypothetical protein